MAEVTEQVVIVAGLRLGEIIAERFKRFSKEIADLLNHQKQENEDNEVTVPLGSLSVETDEGKLNLQYRCKLRPTKDISSGIATVSADEPLPNMGETSGEKPPKKTAPKDKDKD